MSNVLEVTNLSVDFWVDGTWYPAVKDLSFSLDSGKALAIVGESGSGKSTVAVAITSLLPRNARVSGSVKLADQELLGLNNSALRKFRGREVAYIFQEPMTALNPVYSVGFQIVETLRNHFEISPSDAKARAVELLTMVELPDPETAFGKYPHQLSGGQRQRAMIAQALACEPHLLIADEPTTALDVTVQAEILQLMRNLRSKIDSAVLLITHDMGVVADLADDIVVMRSGDAVESGEVHAIFGSPKHEYTQKLLDSVPKLGFAPKRLLEETASTKSPVLEISNVSIEYPKHGRVAAFRAVDDFSLSIYPGEIVGLVGESGSGKTTVGRAAIGLLPISEGKITVAGFDIGNKSQLRQVRKHTGIVFQDPASSLNPRLPIGQSISEPMILSSDFERDAINARVELLLDQVELPRSYRNRYPHELSGGQRQRVGIARALALNPDLLIADEPTSALDVSVQARFLDLLLEMQDRLKFACLFISHDLAVVDVLAHRIAVMNRGKLVEVGDRDQILRAPENEYTKKLLSAVPIADPELQRQKREQRQALLGKL